MQLAMDCFMPSDVARILLGFLKENGYSKTYNCFMKECPLLHEYYHLVKAGRQPITSSLSLTTILDEWIKLKQKEESGCSTARSVNLVTSPDSADDNLICDNDVTKSSNKLKKPGSHFTSPDKRDGKSDPRRRSREGKHATSVVVKKLDIQRSPSKKQVHHSPQKNSPEKYVSHKSISNTNQLCSNQVIYSKSPVKSRTCEKKTRHRSLESEPRTSSYIDKSFDGTTVNCFVNENCDSGRLTNSSNQGLTSRLSPDKHVTFSKPSLASDNHEFRTENRGQETGNKMQGAFSVLREQDASGPRDKTGETSHTNTTPDNAESKQKKDLTEITELLQSAPMVVGLMTPLKSLPFQSTCGEDSLITPIKLFQHGDELCTKSPRRKKPKTPRKRLSDVHISPSAGTLPIVRPNLGDPIFQQILSDTRLHEKLAETCNIVSSQLKLSVSGKEEGKKDVSVETEHKVLNQVQHAMELETITASKSLEEILEMDTNYTSDLLTDKLDMSDPAYESLFKLFSTDREAFCETLKRQKGISEADIQEIEELERSIHEIESANLQTLAGNQGDEGYETQGIAHNSPHYTSQQDMFSSQPMSSPGTKVNTSTPVLGGNVPVTFTPLLHNQGLGTSPLHSGSSTNFPALPHPFSPSHISNPATPVPVSGLTSPLGSVGYTNPGTPATPIAHKSPVCATGPSTPVQLSSPSSNHQHLHSTPHGPSSVRLHTQPATVGGYQQTAISSNNVPSACSPLVKADLHPGSPMMSQKNIQHAASTSVFHSNDIDNQYYTATTYQPEQQGLLGSAIDTMSEITPGIGNQEEDASGFLYLLTDAIDQCKAEQEQAENENMYALNVNDGCSTIDNTISLLTTDQQPVKTGRTKRRPYTRSNEQPVTMVARRHGQGMGKSGSKRRSKRTKKNEKFSTIRGLLDKQLLAPPFVPIPITPKRVAAATGSESIVLLSPGGSRIHCPVLGFQEAGQDVAHTLETQITTTDTPETVTFWNQDLNTSSAEFNLDPITTATITETEVVGTINQVETTVDSSVPAVSAINSIPSIIPVCPTLIINSDNFSVGEPCEKKKKRGRPKKSTTVNTPKVGSSEKYTSPAQDLLLPLEPGENYSATPIVGNFNNRTHVRSLNFGPQADENPNIAHYRKICPRPRNAPPPQVVIIHTSATVPTPQLPAQSVNQEATVDPVQGNGDSDIGVEDTPDKNVKAATPTTAKNVKASATAKNVKLKAASLAPEAETGDVSPQKSQQLTKSTSKSRVSKLKAIKSLNTNRSAEDDTKKLTDNTAVVETNDTDVSNDKMKANEPKITCGKSKKTKNKTPKEKLKVKILGNKLKPATSSEQSKSEGTLDAKLAPKLGGKLTCSKAKLVVVSDESTSSDDLPLAQLKDILVHSTGKKKAVPDTVHSDIEQITNGAGAELDVSLSVTSVESTPRKVINSDDDTFTPSKEEMLEKVGLTPRKNLEQFQSPSRLNVLCAELRSPVSSSKLHHLTRGKLRELDSPIKSPVASKRKVPVKKLFTSPTEDTVTQSLKPAKSEHVAKPAKSEHVAKPAKSEHVAKPAKSEHVAKPAKSEHVAKPAKSEHVTKPAKSEHVTKRVNSIIDILRKNNPETDLIQPGTCSLNQSKQSSQKQTAKQNVSSRKKQRPKSCVNDTDQTTLNKWITDTTTKAPNTKPKTIVEIHTIPEELKETDITTAEEAVCVTENDIQDHDEHMAETDETAANEELEAEEEVLAANEELEASVNNLMGIMESEDLSPSFNNPADEATVACTHEDLTHNFNPVEERTNENCTYGDLTQNFIAPAQERSDVCTHEDLTQNFNAPASGTYKVNRHGRVARPSEAIIMTPEGNEDHENTNNNSQVDSQSVNVTGYTLGDSEVTQNTSESSKSKKKKKHKKHKHRHSNGEAADETGSSHSKHKKHKKHKHKESKHKDSQHGQSKHKKSQHKESKAATMSKDESHSLCAGQDTTKDTSLVNNNDTLNDTTLNNGVASGIEKEYDTLNGITVKSSAVNDTERQREYESLHDITENSGEVNTGNSGAVNDTARQRVYDAAKDIAENSVAVNCTQRQREDFSTSSEKENHELDGTENKPLANDLSEISKHLKQHNESHQPTITESSNVDVGEKSSENIEHAEVVLAKNIVPHSYKSIIDNQSPHQESVIQTCSENQNVLTSPDSLSVVQTCFDNHTTTTSNKSNTLPHPNSSSRTYSENYSITNNVLNVSNSFTFNDCTVIHGEKHHKTEKRRKHKHKKSEGDKSDGGSNGVKRHKHKKSKGRRSEGGGKTEGEKRHHHHKRKKGEKRRRETGEDDQEVTEVKRQKTSPLAHLSKLNVDEALSRLYQN